MNNACIHPFPLISVPDLSHCKVCIGTEFLQAHFGPALLELVLGSCISTQLNTFNLYFCRDQLVAVVILSSSPELLMLALVKSLHASHLAASQVYSKLKDP